MGHGGAWWSMVDHGGARRVKAGLHRVADVGEDGVGVEVVLVILHVGPSVGEGADRGEAVHRHGLLAELTIVVTVELGEKHVVAW